MRSAHAHSQPTTAARPERNATRVGTWPPLFGVVGLAALYAYVWLFLDPLARYYSTAPAFVLASDFFEPHLHQAGGLVEYVGSFLAQLDYWPWLGAGAFVLLLATISALVKRILNSIPAPFRMAWFLPGVLLLSLDNLYLKSVLPIALELLLAFSTLALWLVVSSQRFKGWLLPVLAAVLFWLAGPVAPLLLISTSGLLELLRRERLRAALACWFWLLPCSYAVAQFGGWAASGIGDRLGNRFLLATGVGIYACIPVLCLGAFLWRRLGGLDDSPAAPTGKPVKTSALSRWSRLSVGIGYGAFGLLGGIALVTSFSPEKRALLRIQSEAERENWTGVLQAAAWLEQTPIAARLQIQRALYHLGRLNEDLFAYPQKAGSDVLASLSDGLNVCVPMSDTLVELGHVNLAERYAQEFFEIRGERSELLWRLAWINLIKERPQAARIFLNRLKRVPFHRAKAERWLQSIERDPTMASEGEITQARLRRVNSDEVQSYFSTEPLLRALVRPERPNRMANEYLVAHFLLTRQTEQLARTWALIEAAGNRRTPRHVSEALLAGKASPTARPGEDGKFDPAVSRAFEQFRRVFSHGANGAAGAQRVLAREWGDTYWYYDVFGRTSRTGRR